MMITYQTQLISTTTTDTAGMLFLNDSNLIKKENVNKSVNKDYYTVTEDFFKCCSLEFSIHQTKNLSGSKIIDNNKCFLSRKSAY